MSQGEKVSGYYAKSVILFCLLLLSTLFYVLDVYQHHQLPDAVPPWKSVEPAPDLSQMQWEPVVLPAPPPSAQDGAVADTIAATTETSITATAPVSQEALQETPAIPQVDVTRLSMQARQQAEYALQQAEKGEAAGIQLDWPAERRQRQALFDLLYDCIGIGLGRIQDNQLIPLLPPSQQYSGLLRRIDGQMTHREQQLFARTPMSGTAMEVRLFPRHIDARLFAGLKGLGIDASHEGPIQGRYQVGRGKLMVTHLTIGDQAVTGQILLASDCD